MDQEILQEINNKLDRIIMLLENTKQGSDRMVNHIEFVESVYDTVKKPLNYMLSYVQKNELPEPRPENSESNQLSIIAEAEQ